MFITINNIYNLLTQMHALAKYLSDMLCGTYEAWSQHTA